MYYCFFFETQYTNMNDHAVTYRQLARVFISMCLLIHAVTSRSDGGLIPSLCEIRWFGWLDIFCSRHTPPPTMSPLSSSPPPTLINAPKPIPRMMPRQSPTISPATPPIVLLPCDSRIKTSADLQALFVKATTNVKDPATVIRVCQERIVVPPLFNVTTTSKDTFGFKINYKKIDLQCVRTASSNVRGLCTLEGTGGAGLFYLNNSTLKITGFSLSNGGGKDHSAGGAIYQTNNSFVTLVDSVVKDNIAGNGGGFYNNYTESSERLLANKSGISGRIELVNTVFIGNKALNGGAIQASNTWIIGKDVQFLQNEGGRLGGALGLYGTSTVSLNNSLLRSNYAGGYGGAVFTTDKANVKFYETEFVLNKALGSIVEIHGQSRVELLFSQVKNSLVNDTRPTLFDLSNNDLQEFGVLKTASAIRSFSLNGILFKNSIFSNNKVVLDYVVPDLISRSKLSSLSRSAFSVNTSIEPYDTANLFVDGNGTAACSDIVYCGDLGLTVTCVGSICTNCDRLGSTGQVVLPGEGICYDNVTQCFQSTDELRLAVKAYFSDANDTVKKKYGDPIGRWCVDNIFDFSFLFNAYDFGLEYYFNEKAQYFNEDISEWNTSSAANMIFMFDSSAFNQDISSWDVSKVKDMRGMFANTKFNQNLDAWNVSLVTAMSYMFFGAELFSGSLKNWNVGSVTAMNGMFMEATKFNGNVENWDVSSVIDMSYMFSFAELFSGILMNWNVSGVRNMRAMFFNSTKFNGNLEGWDLSSVTDTSFMFSDAESFSGNLMKWDVSAVLTTAGMFSGARKFNGKLEDWNVSRVNDMSLMFAGAESFAGSLNNWDVSAVINMQAMFALATKFNGELDSWDVSSATNMAFMFSGTESFNMDLSSWTVSSVQTLFRMFYFAIEFKQNLCRWGELLPKEANTSQMFLFTLRCPTTAKPRLWRPIPGPFCYRCYLGSRN